MTARRLGLGVLAAALAACDPLVVDEALIAPALALEVVDAPLVGAGVRVQVRLTGCTRATLRPAVTGRALAPVALEGCDFVAGCGAEIVVPAAELVAAVGIEAFTDADARTPWVEVAGTCEDLGRALAPARADLEARLFSAAARVADPPSRLFVRDVDVATRALWAQSPSGIRVLGYDAAPEVRGPLDDAWYVWRGPSADLDDLAAIGELVLSVESCRFAQPALCPDGLEPRLVASDWGRKLVDLDTLRWPGATIEGLLASDAAAWARLDYGAGGRLAAIELEPRPMQAALPTSGPVRDDGVDWGRVVGDRGLAVGSDAAGAVHLARVDGATLAVQRLEGLGRPVTFLRSATAAGARVLLTTGREPEPRWVLVDTARGRVVEQAPVPETAVGAGPTPSGVAWWTRTRLTLPGPDGPRVLELPAGEEIRGVLDLASPAPVVLTWPEIRGGAGGRVLRFASGGPQVLLDRLHAGDAPEHALWPVEIVGGALYGATERVVFRIDLDPE